MDELLFHPKVVHVPIALGVLMPLISAGVLAAWWRGWLPRRTWVVVVALQAILVGSAWLAHRSGHEQEERVEKVVPEQAIEEHEEAADFFLWGSAIELLLLLVAAVLPHERAALGLASAGVIGALLVFAMAYRVGQLGGELVYRHGAAKAYESPP